MFQEDWIMQIEISEEAKEYIEKKGGAVTIGQTRRKGWVGGSVPLLEVEATSPLNEYMENFNEMSQNGVAVYLDKSMDIQEDNLLRVTLSKLLWLKKLTVEVE